MSSVLAAHAASTLADGIAVARVGEHTLPIVSEGVDEIVTVSEEEIAVFEQFFGAGSYSERLDIDKLKAEKGLTTANFSYARGMGKLTPAKYRGIGEQSEKEILSVVVEAERGDELFAYLFHAADIDRPHGGIIYMQKLLMSTEFRLPTAMEEEA